MPARPTKLALCTLAASLVTLASAPEPSAAAGRLYGVSAIDPPTAAEFQRLAQGGVSSVRVQFYWGDVEPQPGLRNWQIMDNMVLGAAASGITLLPYLHGTPTWVNGANQAAPPIYTDTGRAAWSQFVSELAGRYGTGGSLWSLHPEVPRTPIIFWQLWNEVNLRFYFGDQPNARKYADFARLTRSALKAGDPAAQVISAGLIPFKSTGAGSVPGPRYLRRLFRVKGARGLFDAIGIHPYGKTPRIALKSLEEARKTLASLGSKLPIWVTEFGWTTGGSNFRASPFRASLGGQAKRVGATYKLLRREGKRLNVKRAFYFSFEDILHAASDDWFQHMGLFFADGTPKPAWFSYVRQAGGRP